MARSHHRSLGRWLIPLAAVLGLGLAGCGAGGEKLVPVEGQVMLGDKPLTTGTVILTPDTGKGNRSLEEPRGEIDAQGRFKATVGTRVGAPVGWYKVAVTAADQIDPNNPYFTKWLVPERYIDITTSGLAFEVVANPAPGAYDLKLSPK
jgi:hypothetical protein